MRYIPPVKFHTEGWTGVDRTCGPSLPSSFTRRDGPHVGKLDDSDDNGSRPQRGDKVRVTRMRMRRSRESGAGAVEQEQWSR